MVASKIKVMKQVVCCCLLCISVIEIVGFSFAETPVVAPQTDFLRERRGAVIRPPKRQNVTGKWIQINVLPGHEIAYS